MTSERESQYIKKDRQNSLRISDVWANYWDISFFKSMPEFEQLYKRIGILNRTNITIEKFIFEADTANIERVVLSATDFPGSKVTNKVVSMIVEQYPDRIVGCASVNPHRGISAQRDLKFAVKEFGLKALKLLPFLYERPPNDAIYYPLYAQCIELDIPVLILTGHTAINRPSRFGHPTSLDDIAIFFPELTIIAGHAGWPWTDELVSLAWKHANLYIDTSGHRPKYYPASLVQYMNSYGKEKVLFGTGYPFLDYQSTVQEILDMDLKPLAQQNFLWNNAARIWGWR